MAHGDKHSRDKMDKMLSDTPEEAYEQAQDMGMDEIHSHRKDGELMFMPGSSHDKLQERVGDRRTKMGMTGEKIDNELATRRSQIGAEETVESLGEDVEAKNLDTVDHLELKFGDGDGGVF